MYRKNTASQFIHVQGVDSSTGGIKSGVSWTVRRCIDGTFAAAGGTATEDGTTGWYKFAMSQADTNGNDIGFNFTGTGAVPQTVNIVTTGADPTDSVRFGLTGLANAVPGAAGGLFIAGTNAATTVTTALTTTFTGNLTGSVGSVTGAVGSVVAISFKKNTALAKFGFVMTDATTHNPMTGLTVTATRSIDGAAFAAGTISASTEVGNGDYTVDLGAGDMNGNCIMLRFTATGADDQFYEIFTNP